MLFKENSVLQKDVMSSNESLDKETLLKKKEKQKQLLKKKQKAKYDKEKEKYFNYYDDIKVGSHKIVDW